jgi:hypothetical protein
MARGVAKGKTGADGTYHQEGETLAWQELELTCRHL